MALKMAVLVLYRLKLNIGMARAVYIMTPTWVSRREIGKKLTSDLTKFSIRPKFPRPLRSILEDPSIRKAKSKATAQTIYIDNKKNVD